MVGPARRLAPHDGAVVARLQRIVGVRHGVGRRVDVEQQRPGHVRPVRSGMVQRAAVVDGDRPRRPLEVDDLAHVDGRRLVRLKAADPLAHVAVLVHHGAVVAARQEAQRPLVLRTVVNVGAGGARAVVGVRPERDVLVPLHLVAALPPFEVELRLVELDVRPDEIGDRVGQRRVVGRRIVPERRVMVVHAGEPAQAGALAGVALVEVPDRVGPGDAAAPLHHRLGGGAQPLDPAVGQEFLQQQVAVLEIELALLLRQHARLDGKDLLGRHRRSPVAAAPARRLRLALLIYQQCITSPSGVNGGVPPT